MEKIFTDFGVQPVLLAAQAVNFLILLLILKKFLYRPILKVLEERKQIVNDSLNNAEKIEHHLQNLEEESAQKLVSVSQEAQKILNAASQTADEIIAKAHKKAETDIEQMLVQGKASLLQEKEKLRQEMQAELLDLVISGIEKTAGKVLNQDDHKKIIEQQLHNLK